MEIQELTCDQRYELKSQSLVDTATAVAAAMSGHELWAHVERGTIRRAGDGLRLFLWAHTTNKIERITIDLAEAPEHVTAAGERMGRHNEAPISITVSATRTTDAIAREIKRRLLPAAGARHTEIIERVATFDAYYDRKKRLCTAVGIEETPIGSRHPRTSLRVCGHDLGIEVPTATSAKFEICEITPETARELAAAITAILARSEPAEN